MHWTPDDIAASIGDDPAVKPEDILYKYLTEDATVRFEPLREYFSGFGLSLTERDMVRLMAMQDDILFTEGSDGRGRFWRATVAPDQHAGPTEGYLDHRVTDQFDDAMGQDFEGQEDEFTGRDLAGINATPDAGEMNSLNGEGAPNDLGAFDTQAGLPDDTGMATDETEVPPAAVPRAMPDVVAQAMAAQMPQMQGMQDEMGEMAAQMPQVPQMQGMQDEMGEMDGMAAQVGELPGMRTPGEGDPAMGDPAMGDPAMGMPGDPAMGDPEMGGAQMAPDALEPGMPEPGMQPGPEDQLDMEQPPAEQGPGEEFPAPQTGAPAPMVQPQMMAPQMAVPGPVAPGQVAPGQVAPGQVAAPGQIAQPQMAVQPQMTIQQPPAEPDFGQDGADYTIDPFLNALKGVGGDEPQAGAAPKQYSSRMREAREQRLRTLTD